jgi:iron complex outermembrane recepter protein
MIPAPAHPRAWPRSIRLSLACIPLLWLGAAWPARADAPEPSREPVVVTPEVTITATRGERDVLDTAGNVTVIDRETIERSGVRTLPELLRREAGIFVTNTTTNPEGFTVEARGFHNGGGNGSGTLVLVNGRRVNEPSSAVADWAFLTLDNIERIEVIRGPASAAYGDNALAGVVHVITRHPSEDGVRGTLRGRTGSFDTDAGSLLLEGRAGTVSASAFLDGANTDGFRERSGFRARHGELDLRFALGERGTLGVQGGYASTLRERPGTLSLEERRADRRQAEPGSLGNFDRARQRWVQGRVELELMESVTLRVLPHHRRRGDGVEISSPFTAFLAETESEALGLDAELQIDLPVLGRAHRLLIGGALLREDTDNESLFDLLDPATGTALFSIPASDHNRRRLWGVFVQSELWITDELLLSLGARRDRVRYRGRDQIAGVTFEPRFATWSPRAALTWRIREPVSAYVSYARGFRFPNLDEAFGFFGFAPGLRPERSNAYEAGLKVRSGWLSLNVAVYHMSVRDEILFNPDALNPFFLPFEVRGINVNVDRVRHRGVELSASLRPTAWLELYGSTTLDDVRFARDTITGLDGKRLPITPRHRGTLGARLMLPLGFELGANANYVGSRYVANDLQNEIAKLSRFASYDARIAWRHELTPWLALELEGMGYNLTDRKYEEFAGRSAFAPVVGFFPSPGRHYLAGARITVTR